MRGLFFFIVKGRGGLRHEVGLAGLDGVHDVGFNLRVRRVRRGFDLRGIPLHVLLGALCVLE